MMFLALRSRTAVVASASRGVIPMMAVACSSSVGLRSSSTTATSLLCSSSTMLQSQRFCSSSSSELATANMNLAPEQTQTSSTGTARATDVAKRVNATKRAHQTATPDERKRLERSAWADLNTLSEEEIASADGQAVAIILNAWGYFSKFWERGKEGPIN